MVWITKIIFCGRNNNKTIEINTSTTEYFGKKMYDRQLLRWFKIIVGDVGLLRFPCNYKKKKIDSFVNIWNEKIEKNDFYLDLIKFQLELSNKYECNETITSFDIQLYEIPDTEDNDINFIKFN